MKLCDECHEAEATESSGMCFMCAEEIAHLLSGLGAELGIEMPKSIIAGIAYGQKG